MKGEGEGEVGYGAVGSEGEGKLMEGMMKGSEEDLLMKKGVPVREVMWMVVEYVMVWPFMCHVGLVLFVAWMASCYHFNVPFVSILGFIYLFQIDQRQREKLVRRVRHEGKKSANKLRMEEGETVRWMNEAVEIMWPIFMESFASQVLVKPLTWFLNQYKPWTAKKMAVQSMCLGKTPPVITMIRRLAQPMEGDDLAIEASLEFVADKHMSSVLAVQIRRRIGLGLWTTMHISNVHLEGKVKIGIKFVKGWPLIGRIRLCFATAPYVQVTACPLFNSGVDVAELPLIAQWLDRFLADALTNSLVEPNFLVIDVEKLLRDVLRPEDLVPLPKSEKWFKMEESPPVAEIIVEVLEATDLKIADMNGYSDPFVRGTLGLKHFATKVKWKTLNPKWDEKFKLPITTWERQNILLLKVRDKDRFIDDDLGLCLVELSQYRDGKRHDFWLDLEHVNTGKVHLAITVLEKQNESLGSDETLSNSTTFETTSQTLSQELNRNGLPIPTSPGGLVPPLGRPSPLVVPIPREQFRKQESTKTDAFVLETPKTSRLQSGSWFGSWSLRKVDSSIVRSESGRSVMSVENSSPMGGASGEISRLASTPGSPPTGTTEQEQEQLEQEAQFDDDDDSTNVIDVGFGELGAVSICQLGDFQPASWPGQKTGAPKRVAVVKLEHGTDNSSDQSCSDTESLTNVEEDGGAVRKIRSAGNKLHKIFHRPRMDTEEDAAEPSSSRHRYQEDVLNPSKLVTPATNGTTIQTTVESWDEQGQNINSARSPVELDSQMPSLLRGDQDSEVLNEQGGDSEKHSGHGRAKGLLNMAGNMAGKAASHMGHQLSKRMMRHHRKNVDKEGPSIAAEDQTTFGEYSATSKDLQQPLEPSKADDNSSSKGRRLGNMFSQRRGAPATNSTNINSDVADSGSPPPRSIHQSEELHQTGNQPGAATSLHEPPSRPPPVLPQAYPPSNMQPNEAETPLDLLPPSGILQFEPPRPQQPDPSTFVL